MAGRRKIPRWTLAGMFSLLLHLLVPGVYGFYWPLETKLPRIRLQEVIGVPFEQSDDDDEGNINPMGMKQSATTKTQNPRGQDSKAKNAEKIQSERQESREAEKAEPVPPPPQEVVAHDAAKLKLKEKRAETTKAPEKQKKIAKNSDSKAATKSSKAERDRSTSRQKRASAQQPSHDQEQPQIDESDRAPPLPENLLEVSSTMVGEEEPLEKAMVDGSRIVVYLRTAGLSKSPNTRALRKAMRSVPGYRFYLGESAFDPITDFEWMLIRTPSLSSLTRTRLIAKLSVEAERARSSIERIPGRAGKVTWENHDELQVGIFRRGQELNSSAAAHKVEDEGQEKLKRSLRRIAWGLGEPSEKLYIAGPRRWVENAAKAADILEQARSNPRDVLEEVLLEGEPADLVVVASKLELPLASSSTASPKAEGALLAVRFRDETVAVARLWFADVEKARAFARSGRDQAAELSQHPLARLLDLSRIAETLEFHQQDQEVTIWLRLEPDQASRLLTLITLLLQGEAEPQRRQPSKRLPINN